MKALFKTVCTLSDLSKVALLFFMGFVLTAAALLLLRWAGKSFTESFELASIAVNNFLTPTLLAISIFLLYRTLSVTRTELNKTKKYLKKQEDKELFAIYVQELKTTAELLRTNLEAPLKSWDLTHLRYKELKFTKDQFITRKELKMLASYFSGSVWQRVPDHTIPISDADEELVQKAIWLDVFDSELFDIGAFSLLDYYKVRLYKNNTFKKEEAFFKLESNFRYTVSGLLLRDERQFMVYEQTILELTEILLSIIKKLEELNYTSLPCTIYTSILSSSHISIMNKVNSKLGETEHSEALKELRGEAFRTNTTLGI
ncbi:hypothetical protein [Pseudoalteromonas rubra]|uniref:hypothetical protein n=1 Tax=Pseudoalteromonas rubra TaxID=43658 RepID=UPI002DBC9D49|nr:hypothetical protein [Pseudoalteromonas rubra]MEC4091853.1 hypothetical protein [Pseudoalteromonas rubra]